MCNRLWAERAVAQQIVDFLFDFGSTRQNISKEQATKVATRAVEDIWLIHGCRWKRTVRVEVIGNKVDKLIRELSNHHDDYSWHVHRIIFSNLW